MACAESLKVQAYFDGELDALGAVATETHLKECAHCRALLADLESLRAAIRSELTPQLPESLRARVSAALDASERGTPAAPVTRLVPGRARRPFWLGAAGGLAAGALAAALVLFTLLPSPDSVLLDEVLGAHVRSLMPQHLIDVESTDQHTVKPWFAGHADVSPLVADFAAQGYRLVGGRADYLEHQRAAVVVYQHGAHVINVFSWASPHGGLTRESTRSGYRMMFWTRGDLQYCAVSDTAWEELTRLVRLLQEKSAAEPAG